MPASSQHAAHGKRPYLRLLLMAALSYVAMYLLMYAMVDRVEHALPNWNQAYMAGLMTAPMVLIEILLMRSMYADKRWNALALVGSLLLGIGCFLLIRGQTGIGDRQFLTSMIPHHASALLMCEEAGIHDPEIVELCRKIRAGQQAEIDQMNAILDRLGK